MPALKMNKIEEFLIGLVGFCINGLEICFVALIAFL